MTAPTWVAAVSDAERAAVRAACPLSADLLLSCGPFRVPAAVAAAPGGVEDDPSPVGDALRAVIREDPWGMGGLTPTGWLLVARDETTLVFGQRRGLVGIGAVLTLRGRDGSWGASGLGGAGIVTANPGERVEHLHEARIIDEGDGATGPDAASRMLDLAWDCEADLTGASQRAVARVEVTLTLDAVHLLLVSVPHPLLPPETRGPGRYVMAGTGRTAHHRLRLTEPLGARAVLDDSGIPAHRLHPRPQ